MRLITYSTAQNPAQRLGVRVGHRVLDVVAASRVDGEPLPATLRALLGEGRGASARVQALAKAAQSQAGRYASAMLEERAIIFQAPLADGSRFERVQVDGDIAVARMSCAGMRGHDARVACASEGLACAPHVVFVIGRRASRVDDDVDAFDYLGGMTILHVFGAGAVLALGPELVTLDEVGDPGEIWVTCSVNGHVRVRRNAAEAVARLPQALAAISGEEPLEPGDMIFIEVQAETAEELAVQAGDVIESSMGGVTALRTHVVAG